MTKFINILLVLTVILLGAGVASAYDVTFTETNGLGGFTVRVYPNQGDPNTNFDNNVLDSGQSLTFGVGTYYYIISKSGYVTTQEGSFSGAGTQTFTLYHTPGGVITWDKASYNKGDTATISVSYNSAYFNRSQFYYELYVIDPVTFENVVYREVFSSSFTTSFVMSNEGEYRGYAFVGLASNHNTGVESVTSSRLSAGSTISSFVTWNLHNFIVGQSGTMSWGISPSIYDGIYTYSVKIYNGNTLVKSYDNINNFGTASYTFTSAGNYRTDLVQHLAWDTVISSDPMSVNVIQPQDSISVSASSYETSETVYITGAKYPSTGEKSYSYVTISHGQSITGIISTTKVNGLYPYTFALDYNLPVGSYYASLYGVSSLNDCSVVDSPSVCYKLKDYKTFIVTAPDNGTTGHPDLNISWGATQYKLWESAHFSYQNATYNDTVQIKDNLGTTKYQFKTSDQGIGTLYSGTVQIDSDPKYIGTWTAKIINGSNSADYKTATTQVISSSQANYTNDEGITMNWDQPIGQPGQHTLTWNTGTYSGTYDITLVDGTTGNFIMTFPYKTGSVKAQQYTYTLSKGRDVYTAQFIDVNATILSSASIVISSLGAPGVTVGVTPDPNSISGDNTGMEVTNLLTSKIFWALLFIIGAMIAIAVRSGRY